MKEKELTRLFNKKRREKAYNYHNKKNKFIVLNILLRLAAVVLFFYYNIELKLYNFLSQDLIFTIKLFIYVSIVIFLYLLLNTITEYFTIYDLRKEYNLSAQSSEEWVKDRAKSFVLSLVLTYLFSLLFLFLTNNYPDNWWIIISITLSVFIVLLNYLLPILILPLFYTLKSYPEGELKDRLMSTFDKLDIEIEDIYEINLSSKISSANAAVMGMGKTRKIVLSDNLVGRFSEEEIEAILCHEIGHHINKDIYKNLILSPVFIILTTYITYRILPYIISIFEYQGLNSIISVPIILITWSVIYGIFTPLQLFLSRKYEKEADKYAFKVIDEPICLAKAFVKLADDSLSRLDYSWWEKLFKASHPSIKSRIISAKEYVKNNESKEGEINGI